MDSADNPKDEIEEHVWQSIVTDPVRRAVLEVLYELERPIALADLAIELARESDHRLDDTDWDRAKQLRTSLHHRHILKLQYAGLVEYNPERMTVAVDEETMTTAGNPATSCEGDC